MSALVAVSSRAAERLRAGHLWVYRSDVVRGDGQAGELVAVVDSRGVALGSGLWSSSSLIAVRMVSAEASLTREQYLVSLEQRGRASLALRRELGVSEAGRLIFAEADGLPGIVADRYGDLVVLQLLAQGTARADVRAVVVKVLAELDGVRAIVERPDAKMRELEALEPAQGEALWVREGGTGELHTVFTMNGLRFAYDAGAGQKTGAFLDQRENYAAAARWGRGRALDVCTYHGGFALHLAAARCERVTGVDASRAALEVADGNLELNAGSLGKVDWIEADAFDLLRAYDEAGERFETVVLDPPAFAKSKRAVEGAMRGYKELNLRALKMLQAGGTLVTCSCSHHVGLAEFTETVRAAAAASKRRVQLLEARGAALDHPAMVALPETSYLKCLICRVD